MCIQAQVQKADIAKGPSSVPEGLLKPAALLELNEEDLHMKPKSVVPAKHPVPGHTAAGVSKEIKSRNVLHLQNLVSCCIVVSVSIKINNHNPDYFLLRGSQKISCLSE